MSKKILAVALAAAMILGLASVAFAASFSDTVGHEREAAIKQLAGLGLLDGYPDGTFRPENPITRAEFAKVMVYALGLKDAAEMLAGVPVAFTDVPANHWAVGYISIAASQEIVKGYPDGTFGPQNNVTYAEVITMLLRALGYGPVLDNQPWPTAYLAKATELKLHRGISFQANAPATRGDVAALVANAVSIPKLVPIAWGPDGKPTQYGVSGSAPGTTLTTLLHDMGAESVEGWLESSPELFTNNGKTVKLAGRAADTLVSGTDCTGLLGHKVRLWLNEEGKVFFVEDITPEADVVKADYASATTVDTDDEDGVDVDGLPIFKNYVAGVVGMGTGEIALEDGDEITVIYEDGQPKYVVAVHYAWGVVDSVNTTYGRILFKQYSDNASIVLKDFDVVWSGAASDLDELEENDVVQYVRNASAKKAVVIVTRNAVFGEFTRLTGSAATIDGVAYSYVSDAVGVSYSLLGEEVVAYLNKDGEIVYMTTEEAAPAVTTFAVVIDKTNPTTAQDEWGNPIRKIKLVNSDGSVATLSVTSDVTDATYDSLDAGDVIEYETNSSGNIKAITKRLDFPSEVVADLDINDDLSTIEYGSGAVKLTASTVVFDLTSFNASSPDEDDVKVVSVSSLLRNTEVDAAVYASAGKAKVVVFTGGDATGDALYGLVTSSFRGLFNGDSVWYIRILVEGKAVDYAATDLDVSRSMADNIIGFGNKKVVSFTDLGGGEIKNVTLEGADLGPTVTVGGAVYDVRVTSVDATNGLITVNQFAADGAERPSSTEYFMVHDDTLYYDVSGSAVSLELGDIAKMSKVSLYDIDNDGVLDVVLVHD